jgi:hypothetical protein
MDHANLQKGHSSGHRLPRFFLDTVGATLCVALGVVAAIDAAHSSEHQVFHAVEVALFFACACAGLRFILVADIRPSLALVSLAIAWAGMRNPEDGWLYAISSGASILCAFFSDRPGVPRAVSSLTWPLTFMWTLSPLSVASLLVLSGTAHFALQQRSWLGQSIH